MAMLVKWVTKWSNCQLPSPKDAVANDYTNQAVDKNKKKRQKRNDDTLGIVATNPTRDLLHVERSLPKDSVAISATFLAWFLSLRRRLERSGGGRELLLPL